MRFTEQREWMVKAQIKERGITSESLLQAILNVPRHLFVPEDIRHLAYIDRPLSIGEGQTISQPYIVALMLELLDLQPGDKVLEIGTGSGYQTAIIAEMVTEVFTMERIPALMRGAEVILKKLEYDNIRFKIGDGTRGWDEQEQFSKIIVSAASPEVPNSLIRQLSAGGRLVIPIGNRFMQDLILIEKSIDGIRMTNHGGCAFVPLIGTEGWQE
ncbi:MAG: protein-L-isoaspartate(D-aspartate) O-methyltransferase [Candidatus Cloacimonetes bacterium]|nr:protein-L-isoaspartate(D-aspartate) O-methyltransferase [Candidatus Cloacimonadota bacterium]